MLVLVFFFRGEVRILVDLTVAGFEHRGHLRKAPTWFLATWKSIKTIKSSIKLNFIIQNLLVLMEFPS